MPTVLLIQSQTISSRTSSISKKFVVPSHSGMVKFNLSGTIKVEPLLPPPEPPPPTNGEPPPPTNGYVKPSIDGDGLTTRNGRSTLYGLPMTFAAPGGRLNLKIDGQLIGSIGYSGVFSSYISATVSEGTHYFELSATEGTGTVSMSFGYTEPLPEPPPPILPPILPPLPTPPPPEPPLPSEPKPSPEPWIVTPPPPPPPAPPPGPRGPAEPKPWWVCGTLLVIITICRLLLRVI